MPNLQAFLPFGQKLHPALFHPDYHRRLRNLTESADPSGLDPKGARGLKRQALSPPVGTFTPPRERFSIT